MTVPFSEMLPQDLVNLAISKPERIRLGHTRANKLIGMSIPQRS